MSKEKTIEEILYEKTTTPYWPEHCGHGGYLFSFIAVHPGERPDELIDVYCWDHIGGRQEFCLRFGDEGGDYMSPGEVKDILTSANRGFRPYLECYKLLMQVGDIRFVISDKEDNDE